MAYLNPFSANIMELQWRKVIGLYPTSKDAKQACQEHYNANEERVGPESHLVEHQEGDEGGLSPEAGSRHGPERCWKIQEKQEKVRYP
jgi:hypothetical protein